MDIHNWCPRPVTDLPVTVNFFQTRGGLSNALPFSCKGRYVMVDSTTAGAARRPSVYLKSRAAPAR